MIIKLKPIFFSKVWGGNKICSNYHYNCSENTGEAWGISAHEHGSSVIINTEFKGKTLKDLYESRRDLFGNYHTDTFPILIKIIDAADDLSIQVHPDNDYARKYENSLGKTECWYILDTEKDTEIIIGHKAQSYSEFKTHLNNNDYEGILNIFPVKAGDSFNIYAGTIHAICKGTLLLEIQQSSDVTYRLYDYNRLSNGKLRELHINQALDVVKIPDDTLNPRKPTRLFDYNIIENQDQKSCKADQYGDYIFIMEGEGKFSDEPVKKGDFLFIPANTEYEVTGNLKYFLGEIN